MTPWACAKSAADFDPGAAQRRVSASACGDFVPVVGGMGILRGDYRRKGDGRGACLDRGGRAKQYPGVSGPALIHVVVSGLATGCIYALVALSLVIVYNATRTVNFAQGEMLMVSAFVAWSAQHTAGLPLLAAVACGVAAGGLLAFLVERAIVRRALSATHWDVLIITLGLSLPLRAAAGIVWTNEELPFPALFSHRPVAIGPVRVAPVSLGVIGASLILLLALVALFRATRYSVPFLVMIAILVARPRGLFGSLERRKV